MMKPVRRQAGIINRLTKDDFPIMQNIYLLKDLAKKSGHSTHTLKFYLRLGLLKEIGRSPETKFRYFNDDSFERLKKIKELQKKNYSLREILYQLEHEKIIK